MLGLGRFIEYDMKNTVFLLAVALFFNAASLFSETDVFFSPNGGVQGKIIKHIDDCSATLDVMVYAFSAKPIAQSILRARDRGVSVRIILDRSETKRKGSLYKFLKNNGAEVKLLSGIARKGVMHNKVGIFDGKTLVTGSYNWTGDAERTNYDNALFTDDLDLVQEYRDEFDKLWDNAE